MTDYVGANFDVGEAVGPEAVVVTCRAGGAISKGGFVKLSDGQDFTVVTATAGSTVYGVAERAAAAAGEYIPVCAFGRVKMTAGAAEGGEPGGEQRQRTAPERDDRRDGWKGCAERRG